MGSHVWRPLFVIIVLVIAILISRFFIVPHDFGIRGKGYMYGWYREGNIEDWKNVKVKYQGKDYCKDCHADKFESILNSPHAIIQCENCHGPALDHPSDPPKLAIDRSRATCFRCHYPLPYPSSGRAKIKSVDPDTHNAGIECSTCHNPHKPNLAAQ